MSNNKFNLIVIVFIIGIRKHIVNSAYWKILWYQTVVKTITLLKQLWFKQYLLIELWLKQEPHCFSNCD